MTVYARVDGGVIFELIMVDGDPPLNERFPAAVVATLHDVTAINPPPKQGWTYNGTIFAAPVAAAVSLPDRAAAALATRIAAGIGITSTGAPALNATYALDSASTAQIFQLGLYAAQFATFPGGATQVYPDATGTPHTFTVTQFVAFLRAVAPLVSALTTQAGVMAAGGSPTWPAQTATIP